MFFKGGVIYHGVVQAYDNEIVEKWLEKFIDKNVKCGRCISKDKQHNKEFERSIPCDICCIRFVSLGNTQSASQVRWIPCSVNLVEKIHYQGNRLIVLNFGIVERSIVDVHLKRSIILLLEDDWCTKWSLGLTFSKFLSRVCNSSSLGSIIR